MKWLLIGVAVLLVIATSVGITLVVTRDGSGPNGNTSTAGSTNASDVASANDTGPVSIITADPTCSTWTITLNALANVESNGWRQRDQSSESSSWTPQVRAQYEAVGAAMRNTADQAIELAKQTPHRVMREMYEQFIAYGRAYADSLSSYQPADDLLSLVNVHLADSIAGVCNAIDRGGIAIRNLKEFTAQEPKSQTPVGDLSRPERFILKPSSSCSAWIEATASFEANLQDWEHLDPGITAAARSSEQRVVAEAATRAFESYASTAENLGRQEHREFEDFATLAALYLRAYAAVTATYIVPDSWISVPGLRLNNVITEACKAAAD